MNQLNKLNQKGQALIEYIMLLFIAVLMVLGLVYQFNDAFRQYLNAWFKSDEGGYLFCLIQNGYLPGESDTCTLPQFNLKNGKKLSSDGIGGTGSAKNGASNGSNGSGNSSSGNNAGGGGSGNSGFSSGGRVNEAGRGGPLIPANLKGVGAGGSGKGGGGADGGASTGDSGFSSGGPLAPGAFGSKQRARTRTRYVPYGAGDDEDGTNSQSKGKNQTIPASEREIRAARLVAADSARKKRLQEQDTDTTITFGNVFKYAAIFALVFSLIFFIGSMVVAISRGGRKRE